MIQCVERGGNVIDLKKANEEFDKYVKNYNSEDKKIALKIEHINFANSMFSLSKFKFSDIIPDISETLLICSIFKAIFLSSEL